MSHPTCRAEVSSAVTPGNRADVLVARRHDLLVRCSHWLNVPILLGLILSGLSIYWASPVYQNKPSAMTGNVDPLLMLAYGHARMYPGCINTAVRLTGSTTT